MPLHDCASSAKIKQRLPSIIMNIKISKTMPPMSNFRWIHRLLILSPFDQYLSYGIGDHYRCGKEDASEMKSIKFGVKPIEKMIESTPEYMRKLFIMPDSSDKFVEFGIHLLDLIHDFFKERGGIHSSISMEDLAEIFNNIEMPDHPHLIKDVLDEIKHNVVKHSVKVANPFYIGHMTSAVPYFMILLEMIAVSLNQNRCRSRAPRA